MASVALIGLDGAGKSTVGRAVEKRIAVPAKYIYMGINLESSNLVLPTTRILLGIKRMRGKRPVMAGPSSPHRSKGEPKGLVKRTAAGIKSAFRLTTLVGEELLRLGVAAYYEKLGYLVLFDRHFYFDYYTNDVANGGAGQSRSSRLHGYLLEHVYPKPDLVIYLDAPAELLYARKGEGTLEWLEQRRQEYMELGARFQNLHVLDASRPVDVVTYEVIHTISEFYSAPAESVSQSTTAGTLS